MNTADPRSGGAGRGLLLAAAAAVLFSTSPVLIRWAAPLGAFEITAGRLAVAAVAVAIFGRIVGARRPARGDWKRLAAIGLAAALHFFGYIASLSFTTISHSLALVYTAPVFVALFSWWRLGERLTRRGWIGVAVTVLGVTVLAGLEPRLTARMAIGDLLALGSAVMFGIYSVAGRSHRGRMDLATYAAWVYGFAALWAAPAAAATFTPGGWRPGPTAAVIGLGLVPLGLGHTLYNAALRRTDATRVNLVATQEVTGGILLGALLLGELPRWNEIVGAALALAGIAVVIIGGNTPVTEGRPAPART